MTTSNEAVQATSRSPPTTSSPSVDHNRRKHPCVLCQQRKVKCDRNDPCANCTKARVQCVSSTMLPPKRRKKRFPEAELLARLRRYEDHLRRYGADIDAINNEANPVFSALSNDSLKPEEYVPDLGISAPRQQPRQDAIQSLAIRRSLKHVKNNLYQDVNDEFRDAEKLLQGSSDDETLETPIFKTYDAINPDGSDFLFPTPSSDSITDFHPSTVHIFRLWQSFIDNVNPLIKIFHAPTVQQRILEASADIENVPKGMEALMFGIYAMAITSLMDADCMLMFGEEKSVLLARYQSGARVALSRAGLLRSSDMTILTAFILYLMSCLNFSIDPRSHFCLTGIAIRIAQRMGLNYDGTTYGLAPYETEMRRRLWYQLIFLDNRVSELSGAGYSILSYIWTTKPPLNVNDSDLFPDMKDPPLESKGATEMLYVLQRCEVANMLQKVRNGSVGETHEEKDAAIMKLQQSMSERWERYCDLSVPLHLLTTLMSDAAIGKMLMGLRHPHLMNTSVQPATEKDRLFLIALRMVEVHNAMLGTPTLKRFMWHICTNFPFPAHVYLLYALRQRTTGPLVERAWNAFGDHYKNRRAAGSLSHMAKHRDSALQIAIANMTIKAWDARERDVTGVEVPKFVLHLRYRLGDGRNLCLNEKGACFNTEDEPQPSAGDEKVPSLTSAPVFIPETQNSLTETPISNTTAPQVDPYQWLNIQPANQSGMVSMGMGGFDDEIMQGLMPTFNGDLPNSIFGIDIWGDYQPDMTANGATVNMNVGGSFEEMRHNYPRFSR